MRLILRLSKLIRFFKLNFRFDKEFMSERLNVTVPFYGSDKIEMWHPTSNIFNQLQSSSCKHFVIFNELALSMLNYKKEPKDRLTFHQLDKKLFSHNIHVSLPLKSNFLYSTFDWKITQLVQGGFFNHWMDRYLSHPSVKAPEPEDNRVALTLDHLSVGFIIWLGMLLIATVAMITELVRFKLANYFRGIFLK